MPVVERLVAGEQVVGHVFQVHRAFAHAEFRVDRARRPCPVTTAFTPGTFAALARVDGHDARVRMRAADDDAEEHARQREVGAVVGASGDLVDAVVTDGRVPIAV